ncbi:MULTISPECIES: LysR family transcriptional regulator [unclassified Pseudomonas]|uniref:LysR family transcriptional regulator n=1 Tax=unclassified Pseudomonas TaxID=196821 RepID=UPI0015BF7849|nr:MULTISPECIES: LysR family transcriptional regulator [unclassified Pseudomonas]MCS4250003.1 DNA-binding transcriptional LysR family regulator [Pseudomonas sp. BIGb0164]NWE23823.1 LysR family transcriptional regulator [Pseudomonas sp. P7548]
MADEISDLRLFVRIVAAGSLSEAARRLHSSLPAVSRRLAGLESRLGVRLINRGSRHFSLTEEGALLHERGLFILDELDAAVAEVGTRLETPHGHIRVGAPLEIGRRRIAPLIAEFSRRYPRITVELLLSDSPADVAGDDLDVGLLTDNPSDTGMVSRRLLSSRRVVCASPDYLAQHGTPQTPQDLLHHDCLRLVRGRRIFDRWTFQENGHGLEVQIKGTLLSNNAEVIHDWAVGGSGIVLKALWDIQDDLRDGRLIALLEPYANDYLFLNAVFPSRRHLPPRVRVFLDFLADALQQQDANPEGL